MASLFQDVRYGARLLLKVPAFSAISIAALALGIGAATAIFSVVDAVLLKPLPFREPGRLLAIYEKNPARNRFRLFVPPGNLREWQRQSRIMEAMAAVQEGMHASLSGGPNGQMEPEELRVERVSAGLFPLLGVQPVVGRGFREEEDRPGHVNYALLSYALWQRRFAGDRGIPGKAIRLREQSYTVLGVLPAGFAIFDSQVDVWVPLGLNPNDPKAAAARSLVVIARLRPGAGIQQAKSEMDAIGARLEAANPAVNAGFRPSVFPFRDELVAFHDEHMGSTRRALLVLLGAVGCLLLMACVNVANLLLARGAARQKEIAIRTAMGATRRRVVTQLLSESLLLALAGGALGVALAFGAIALTKWLGPAAIPRLAEVKVDGRLLLFALSVSLATGTLFGLAPALRTTGVNLNATLIEGGRSGTIGRTGRFLRNLLAVAEVTLAVVLLIGAGLLIRSFTRLRAANPGFQPAGLLTFRLPLAGRVNASPERRAAFVQQVTERVASLPGVRAAGAANALPLTGFGSGSTFTVAGRPAPASEQRPMGLVRSVTPSYFRTMGIPLLAGRDFAASDTRDRAPAIVVNQTLARRFWPDGDALGGRLTLEQLNNGWTAQVVGVVGNVSPEKLEGEDWPTIYVPYPQWATATMVVVARTAGAPLALAPAVAREIHRMEPEQAVADVRTMEEVLDAALADSRFHALVLGLFAGIAFVLAAVGVYGVISYGVTERIHELGIRMALGAQRNDVLKLVLGEGARLAAYGIAAGLAAAWALTRLMSTMLYGVEATDFCTFAAIAFLLGGVALVASYIPSRRAMALDPVNALRHE
jgi:putative ABC transport system permease protein